jgi:hypothetical protein
MLSLSSHMLSCSPSLLSHALSLLSHALLLSLSPLTCSPVFSLSSLARAVKSKLSSAPELEAMPLHQYRNDGGGWGTSVNGAGGEDELPLPLDFPMPEMVFGNSILEFKHLKSGFVFHFSTLDALHHCRLDHPYLDVAVKKGGDDEGAGGVGQEERVLKVPVAAIWGNRKLVNSNIEIKPWEGNYDWTYSCPGYKGNSFGTSSVRRWRTDKEGVANGQVAGGAKRAYTIDYDRLKRRDPILWFDDIDLYESELDDNGEAKLSVKVRVMPSCFFCLQRFYLRLDKVLMRIYDTR